MDKLSTFAFELYARERVWPLLPTVIADAVTGEIVYVTEHCANIFGYTPAELLGKKLEMLIPDSARSAHEKFRQTAQAPAVRSMGVGRRVAGLRKDGQEFPAHVGLVALEMGGRKFGVALVLDVTNFTVGGPGESGIFPKPPLPPPAPDEKQREDAQRGYG